MQRKRSKVARYDPKLMQELRAAIIKSPNPMFGEMLKESGAKDSDVMDFALRVANAYFSGELLEQVTTTALSQMDLVMRRSVLQTAATLGATATFAEDRLSMTITRLKGADADTRTAALQALVDVGVSVSEAQSLLADPTPTGQALRAVPAPPLSKTVN